jgi:ABC-type sugar transport system permease subunit
VCILLVLITQLYHNARFKKRKLCCLMLVSNWLHVTIVARRIWRWLLDICRTCGLLALYLPMNSPELLHWPSVRKIEKVGVILRKLYNWSLSVKTEVLKASCACSFGVTKHGPANNHSVINVSFVQTWHSSGISENSDSGKGYISCAEKARKCRLSYACNVNLNRVLIMMYRL